MHNFQKARRSPRSINNQRRLRYIHYFTENIGKEAGYKDPTPLIVSNYGWEKQHSMAAIQFKRFKERIKQQVENLEPIPDSKYTEKEHLKLSEQLRVLDEHMQLMVKSGLESGYAPQITTAATPIPINTQKVVDGVMNGKITATDLGKAIQGADNLSDIFSNIAEIETFFTELAKMVGITEGVYNNMVDSFRIFGQEYFQYVHLVSGLDVWHDRNKFKSKEYNKSKSLVDKMVKSVTTKMPNEAVGIMSEAAYVRMKESMQTFKDSFSKDSYLKFVRLSQEIIQHAQIVLGRGSTTPKDKDYMTAVLHRLRSQMSALGGMIGEAQIAEMINHGIKNISQDVANYNMKAEVGGAEIVSITGDRRDAMFQIQEHLQIDEDAIKQIKAYNETIANEFEQSKNMRMSVVSKSDINIYNRKVTITADLPDSKTSELSERISVAGDKFLVGLSAKKTETQDWSNKNFKITVLNNANLTTLIARSHPSQSQLPLLYYSLYNTIYSRFRPEPSTKNSSAPKPHENERISDSLYKTMFEYVRILVIVNAFAGTLTGSDFAGYFYIDTPKETVLIPMYYVLQELLRVEILKKSKSGKDEITNLFQYSDAELLKLSNVPYQEASDTMPRDIIGLVRSERLFLNYRTGIHIGSANFKLKALVSRSNILSELTKVYSK